MPPNPNHRLFIPDPLMTLSQLSDMKGLREEDDGALVIGAGETLIAVGAAAETPPLRRLTGYANGSRWTSPS